jgi:hypothetical protein
MRKRIGKTYANQCAPKPERQHTCDLKKVTIIILAMFVMRNERRHASFGFSTSGTGKSHARSELDLACDLSVRDFA